MSIRFVSLTALAICVPALAGPAASTGAGAESSLAAFVDRLGRAPDASQDGGACGGIMIHDWHAEGLRVISQGDQIQQVTRKPAGVTD